MILEWVPKTNATIILKSVVILIQKMIMRLEKKPFH